MRISDWSSDVCSSDLFNFVVDTGSERTVISRELASKLALAPDDPVRINSIAGITQVNTVTIPRLSYGRGMMPSVQAPVLEAINLGAPGDRTSVGEGKGVSVRVDIGGRRNIKKK